LNLGHPNTAFLKPIIMDVLKAGRLDIGEKNVMIALAVVITPQIL